MTDDRRAQWETIPLSGNLPDGFLHMKRLPECEIRSAYPQAVIRNMAIDPQGRMFKAPASRVRRAWLVLRGWKLYGP